MLMLVQGGFRAFFKQNKKEGKSVKKIGVKVRLETKMPFIQDRRKPLQSRDQLKKNAV